MLIGLRRKRRINGGKQPGSTLREVAKGDRHMCPERGVAQMMRQVLQPRLNAALNAIHRRTLFEKAKVMGLPRCSSEVFT
jgi:hypothetical protein